MTHATAHANVKGVLGEKLGMTQVWDADNRLVPVTVIKAGPNVVTQVRGLETDGYAAVQIAFGAIDPRKVNKPMTGHFEKAGVTPRRHLVELRTADAADYTLGQEVTVEVFEAGQKVDVSGTTKGKGFAGVMKRHGFHGVSASHGAEPQPPQARLDRRLLHPRPRVQGHADGRPHGRRAPDHPEPHVHAVDAEKGLLLIKGAVPGPRGGLVLVRTRREGGLTHDDRRPSPFGHHGRSSSCPPRSSTCRPTSR
jgi:large subunit ribosomal protein L3